ncbi:hypothetical protein C8R46DRAFT_1114783 [Mycena filopes]|nr:hypothetical protein C8R46DRAFT_1114783 [Mycena filopes]
MVRRNVAAAQRTAAPRRATSNKKKAAREQGWIWSQRVGKMETNELKAWILEGDRIQWFRAEAEAERWREQVETVLADWRTIRSFARHKVVWMELASMQAPEYLGHIAFAKQQSHMFARREMEGH